MAPGEQIKSYLPYRFSLSRGRPHMGRQLERACRRGLCGTRPGGNNRENAQHAGNGNSAGNSHAAHASRLDLCSREHRTPRVRVKILPAPESTRGWLQQTEINFDGCNRRHRRATGSDSRLEAPGTHGFDCFLIQSETSTLHDLDVGCMAVRLNDHLKDHNSLKLSLARVF